MTLLPSSHFKLFLLLVSVNVLYTISLWHIFQNKSTVTTVTTKMENGHCSMNFSLLLEETITNVAQKLSVTSRSEIYKNVEQFHFSLCCIVDKLRQKNNSKDQPDNLDICGSLPSIEDIRDNICPHFLTIMSEKKRALSSFLAQPVINRHNFSYIHVPRKKCGDRDPDVLITVPSAPGNFERRQKMREHIQMNYTDDPRNKARLLFFLGTSTEIEATSQIQTKIEAEVIKFDDIVQEDFNDIYKNIRLKAVSMLRWASTYCAKAKFVIRIDDDILVKPGMLVSSLKKKKQAFDNFIVGKVMEGDVPARDKKVKWYLSKKEYLHSKLPRYALGGLLGYPLSSVKLLYQAALRTPPIWLDDVYITGMCAEKVQVPLLEDENFTFEHKTV